MIALNADDSIERVENLDLCRDTIEDISFENIFAENCHIVRSTVNILANVSLLLSFFSEYIARALSVSEEVIVLIVFFGIYALLRLVYFMISMFPLIREDLRNNN